MDIQARLREPIGIDIIFDGWAKCSAQRFVFDLMNLTCPTRIPLYIPPGTTERCPYGKAGKDCPYPILRRGCGMEPKWRFTPEQSAEEVLLALATEFAEIEN